MIGNSDDEINFPHKLLLTNRQVPNIRKAFANHTSTDIKLSKTQLSKTIQLGGFLGRRLGPLLKTGVNRLEVFRHWNSLDSIICKYQNCDIV